VRLLSDVANRLEDVVGVGVDDRDRVGRLVGDEQLPAIWGHCAAERFGTDFDRIDHLSIGGFDHGYRAAGHVGHVDLLVVGRDGDAPWFLADLDFRHFSVRVVEDSEQRYRVVVRVHAPDEAIVRGNRDGTRIGRRAAAIVVIVVPVTIAIILITVVPGRRDGLRRVSRRVRDPRRRQAGERGGTGRNGDRDASCESLIESGHTHSFSNTQTHVQGSQFAA
jgi:hypothetical protein